jgi:hypothetical protein
MLGSSDIVGCAAVEVTSQEFLLVELNQLACGQTLLDKLFPFLL